MRGTAWWWASRAARRTCPTCPSRVRSPRLARRLLHACVVLRWWHHTLHWFAWQCMPLHTLPAAAPRFLSGTCIAVVQAVRLIAILCESGL